MKTEIKIPKIIGKFYTKTKTTSGYLCKTTCVIFEDGIISVCQLILCDKQEVPGYRNIYSKFGKHLLYNSMGFKYPTLNSIHRITTDILIKNKIDPKNILK